VLVLLLSSLLNVEAASAACLPKSANGFASDSSITDNQVLVCATATEQKSVATATSTKSSVKSTSKPAPVAKPEANIPAKSNCPSAVATTAQIVAAALAGCKIPGPSLPPAVAPKPVATVNTADKVVTQVARSTISAAQSDQALFSPQPLAIQTSVELAEINQAVIFTSDAREHVRAAVILGKTGYVRFEPVAFAWSTSTEAGSPVSVASFATTGTKNIWLRVTYRASTRFSLAEPWQIVGQVFVDAETRLEIVEPAKSRNTPQPRAIVIPRLVFASCETMPSAYRC
jgi:hypothetical protein